MDDYLQAKSGCCKASQIVARTVLYKQIHYFTKSMDSRLLKSFSEHERYADVPKIMVGAGI